ncbi:MAG: hypothetical protein K5985_07900 [Lachnospiraceae bacterium]|nr:hypothetical protein [Lachnospiraceae bacterium]
MCLIITFTAAILSTVLWYFLLHDEKYHFTMLLYMFWGATLMWTVDGIFSYAGGEGFFDLSASDAALGMVIVLSALAVWVVRILVSDPGNVLKNRLFSRM